jgi:fumarate reductase subunit C
MNRRPYERPVSKTTWYMRNKRYRSYMLRELTCVLVAFYCVLVLFGLMALTSSEPAAWNAFLAGQKSGGWMIFHGFALVFFTIFQTMAWFRLAPKAMPIQGETISVAPGAIVAAHYLGWIAVTLIVFWLSGVF